MKINKEIVINIAVGVIVGAVILFAIGKVITSMHRTNVIWELYQNNLRQAAAQAQAKAPAPVQ